LEVDKWFPLFFCVFGSGVLVVLFFLMKYLIYVIIAGFCLGGTGALFEILYLGLSHYVPGLQRVLCSPRDIPFEAAHLVSGAVAATIVTGFLVMRNEPDGWFFQDLIGAAFLCLIQRSLRLPDMKLASVLLTVMFFFDIFWVFVSPLLFKKSVMVEVATGGGTGESVPMLLRLPALGDPLGNQRMLGFGDVALPGLLVSFLRRFDILSGRSLKGGYFLPAVIGYTIAMFVTLMALYIMRIGQPALLYLVPGTLGTTLVLAWRRGELQALWKGTPLRPAAERTLDLTCATGGRGPQGVLLEPPRQGPVSAEVRNSPTDCDLERA